LTPCLLARRFPGRLRVGLVRHPLAHQQHQFQLEQQRQRCWELYSSVPRSWSASAKARPPRSSAARLHRHQQTPRPVACSCCTPGRCPIIPTAVYPTVRHRLHRDARRVVRRAGLCRQGISQPGHAKCPSRLHFGLEARRIRRHQARAAAPLRRAHHRTPEGEGHLGRCYLNGRRRHQRRALGSGPQLSPYPRLAQGLLCLFLIQLWRTLASPVPLLNAMQNLDTSR
jgi:transposase, IS5 family